MKALVMNCSPVRKGATARIVEVVSKKLKEKYEVFHGVKIQDQALVTAASLSGRYISDRFLPDKAIDLVDEACALIKTEMESMPTELDDLSRQIMQHEIEEAALKNETDKLSKDRLEKLQKEPKKPAKKGE